MVDCNWTSQDGFFDILYQKQFRKMWLLAITLVEKPELAEEVVQDAFVEVLIHIDYLMTVERPDFWLQKTVRNKALHALRERTRDAKRLIELRADGLVDDLAARQLADVEETDSLSHTKQLIVETLTPSEFHLSRRIAMEGASYRTVSEELGISISACQKKVQRIRKKLKKQLSRNNS